MVAKDEDGSSEKQYYSEYCMCSVVVTVIIELW